MDSDSFQHPQQLLQDLSPEVGDTLLNTKLTKKHTICNQAKYVW